MFFQKARFLWQICLPSVICGDTTRGRHSSYLVCLRSHVLRANCNFESKQANSIALFGPRPDNKIHRRAKKFSLSLPYQSEVSYKQRLLTTGLLPLSYWHEFLDLVYVFKCLVSLSDPFISVMNSTRPRRTVSSKGTLLRTVFTVEPQESGILCQPTSGTLTVQWRTLRKIFLITTCISQSLFMMSTPPRPLRPIHKRGFAPGPCSRLILHVSVHTRERFQVCSTCPGSLLPNI